MFLSTISFFRQHCTPPQNGQIITRTHRSSGEHLSIVSKENSMTDKLDNSCQSTQQSTLCGWTLFRNFPEYFLFVFTLRCRFDHFTGDFFAHSADLPSVELEPTKKKRKFHRKIVLRCVSLISAQHHQKITSD